MLPRCNNNYYFTLKCPMFTIAHHNVNSNGMAVPTFSQLHLSFNPRAHCVGPCIIKFVEESAKKSSSKTSAFRLIGPGFTNGRLLLYQIWFSRQNFFFVDQTKDNKKRLHLGLAFSRCTKNQEILLVYCKILLEFWSQESSSDKGLTAVSLLPIYI